MTSRTRRPIGRPRRPHSAALRNAAFRDRVHALVARIPRGKVVTYGQLAALAGNHRAARQVGWIAHAGRSGLPWQRVVNRFGGLARGYDGGRPEHRRALLHDGIPVRHDDTVDLPAYQWRPGAASRRMPV